MTIEDIHLDNGKEFTIIRTNQPQNRNPIGVEELGTDIREVDWEGGILVLDYKTQAFITNCEDKETLQFYLNAVSRSV